MDEPYTVEISHVSRHVQKTVFSPSNSSIMFLPIARTFFADIKSDLAFTDGMPTKYNQEVEGEITALLTLPAKIIEAWFGAIGAVFDSFKKTDSSESVPLNQSLVLHAVRVKYEACQEAYKAEDKDSIKKLDC